MRSALVVVAAAAAAAAAVVVVVVVVEGTGDQTLDGLELLHQGGCCVCWEDQKKFVSSNRY